MKKDLGNIFYVYFHYRKDDGKIFYVGKGFKNRYKSTANRNKYWHNTVNKHGYYSNIVQDNLSESDAFELEVFCIKEIGKENLCNITDGGDGVCGITRIVTQETKDKLKGRIPWNKGVKYSDEQKLLISKSMTEDVRNKISESVKKSYTEELREFRRQTQLNMSDDVRLKISNSRKGIKPSNESKLKNRISHLNKISSSETKLKISLSHIGFQKGFVYITNKENNIMKCINPIELDNYLNDGWVKGRIKKSSTIKDII